MTRWWTFPTALAASLAIHAAVDAGFRAPPEPVKLEGRAKPQIVIKGTASQDFFKGAEVVPNELKPVEAESFQPTEAPDVMQPVSVKMAELVPVQSVALVSPVPLAKSSSVTLAVAKPVPRVAATPPIKKMQAMPVAQKVPEQKPIQMVKPKSVQPVKPSPFAQKPPPLKPRHKAVEVAKRQPTRVPPVQAVKPVQRVVTPVSPATPPKMTAPTRGTSTVNAKKGRVDGGKSSGSQISGSAEVTSYPGKVRTKLHNALRYPRRARIDRLSGTVVVRFVVTANQQVSDVVIVESSGSSVLDRAALQAVQRAVPFPIIPEQAGRASWTFTIPLEFSPKLS